MERGWHLSFCCYQVYILSDEHFSIVIYRCEIRKLIWKMATLNLLPFHIKRQDEESVKEKKCKGQGIKTLMQSLPLINWDAG